MRWRGRASTPSKSPAAALPIESQVTRSIGLTVPAFAIRPLLLGLLGARLARRLLGRLGLQRRLDRLVERQRDRELAIAPGWLIGHARSVPPITAPAAILSEGRIGQG